MACSDIIDNCSSPSQANEFGAVFMPHESKKYQGKSIYLLGTKQIVLDRKDAYVLVSVVCGGPTFVSQFSLQEMGDWLPVDISELRDLAELATD